MMASYSRLVGDVEEVLDVPFQLLHDGLPTCLRRVHVVPEEVVLWVGADAVLGATVLVHLPVVATGIHALAARLQLLRELLRHLRV
jgi:hypothetical protein